MPVQELEHWTMRRGSDANTIYEESLCKGRSHSRETSEATHASKAGIQTSGWGTWIPDLVPLRFMNLPAVDLAPLRSISRACALVWGRE